jgi:hypothetical protein
MVKLEKIHACCRKTECTCECNHSGKQDREVWCEPCKGAKAVVDNIVKKPMVTYEAAIFHLIQAIENRTEVYQEATEQLLSLGRKLDQLAEDGKIGRI